MESKKNPGDRLTKGLRYTARFISSGIGGLLLLLIIIIAISESIEKGFGFGVMLFRGPWDSEKIRMAIYIVVVPIGVIIAWWKEGIGGAILIIWCLVHMISYYFSFGVIETRVSLIMFGPFLVSGVLFLICWWRSRRLKIPESAA